MRRLLVLATLLFAGSAMAQQQSFRYLCAPPNTSMTVAVSSLTGGGSCNTNIGTPNIANDYPNVLSSVFDSTVIVGDGHITSLRVQAVAFTGGGGGSVLVACGDDNDSIRVHDGDHVGAYYATSTGVLTIYINTTATALQCSVPNIVFPGTVASMIQAEFFKK